MCGTYSDHCCLLTSSRSSDFYISDFTSVFMSDDCRVFYSVSPGSSLTSHPPLASLLCTILPTQCQVHFTNSVGAYWSIAVERSALFGRTWGWISDRKTAILSRSFNTNSLHCCHLLKYRCWSLLASLTDKALVVIYCWWGAIVWEWIEISTAQWSLYFPPVVTICTTS